MFVALWRSMRSLMRLDVFGHLIWPAVVSALIWSLVLFFSWAYLIDTAMKTMQGFGWVGEQISASVFMAGLVLFLVKVLVLLLFMPLFYVTSLVLVSVVALPMMLDRVADRDYADLEQRRGGSTSGSIVNTVVAILWFVLVLLFSLPLWWLPGVALIAPVLATGWLNQRIFGYDALMRHADRDELSQLRQKFRPQLLLLGMGATLLAYIPVVNIIAPALTGLVFVHFLLETLRGERGNAEHVMRIEP